MSLARRHGHLTRIKRGKNNITMASNKLFNNLPEDQRDLSARIFDMVSEKVFVEMYSGFDIKTKADMDKIFTSDNDDEKKMFIKKHIPDFKKLFKEGAKKIEGKIKLEIEKQV